MIAALLLALEAVNAAGPVATGVPPALRIESSLERLTPARDGSEESVIEPAGGGASHADDLIYTVRFANTSRQVVDTLRITAPIPAELRYLPESATGPASETLFSADLARTFGRPEELTVVGAGGLPRSAGPADYTHVRWIFDGALDAGAVGVVRFRAVPR